MQLPVVPGTFEVVQIITAQLFWWLKLKESLRRSIASDSASGYYNRHSLILSSFSVLDFSVKDKTWEDCGNVPEIDMKIAKVNY